MSRLPPSLVHFVVYNPTLFPPEQTEDEDVREKAHVLFYTANDRAVSQNTVLRQVGLAKALVSFTTVFDPYAVCESVHSQRRRMIMFSPEPDFWIHACFELEIAPRLSDSQSKSGKNKGKHKEGSFVYLEASLHDEALRATLRFGYEAFRLIYGSFTSILRESGRKALEVQLENFFTAWLWNEDFSKQMAFSDYIGVRAHHLSNRLEPLMQTLEEFLPTNYSPLVLVSSCVFAPRSAPFPFPLELVRHFLNILERSSASSDAEQLNAHKSSDDLRAKSRIRSLADGDKEKNNNSNVVESNRPIASARRKWYWTEVLTLGLRSKSSGASEKEDVAYADADARSVERMGQKDAPEVSCVEFKNIHHEGRRMTNPVVDMQALTDALSVEDVRKRPVNASLNFSAGHPGVFSEETRMSNKDGNFGSRTDGLWFLGKEEVAANAGGEQSLKDSPQVRRKDGLTFSDCPVHISDASSSRTYRRIVKYVNTGSTLLALVPKLSANEVSQHDNLPKDLSEKCIKFVRHLKEVVETEEQRINIAFSSSPIQSILEKSRSTISTPNKLVHSSAAFPSTSWHLFDCKRLLDTEEIQEVYCRGQNPQDWHLAKRIVATLKENSRWKGEIFMEIERKEASLVDVDNEILAAVRRFNE